MDFFRNLKTRMKLFASFSLLILVVIGLGGVSIANLADLKWMLQTFYTDRFVPAVDLGKVSYGLASIRIGALQILTEPDAAKRQAIFNKASEDEKEINALVDKYMATRMEGEETRVADEFVGAWKSYNESRLNTYNWALEGLADKAKENAKTDAAAKFKTLDGKITRLIEIQDEIGKKLYEAADADFVNVRNFVIAATIIAIIAALILVYILTSLIAKPLARLTGVANKLAEGALKTGLSQVKAEKKIVNAAQRFKTAHIQNDLKTARAAVNSHGAVIGFGADKDGHDREFVKY